MDAFKFPREKLSNEIAVPTDMVTKFQAYQWYYYLPIGGYAPKVCVYFRWKETGTVKKPKEKTPLAKRSTYFMNLSDMDRFIIESVWAELKLKEITHRPDIPLAEVRLFWLNQLLKKIGKDIIKRWRG